MRAMLLRSYGGPDEIEVADVPRPSPGAQQVLLRVRATSVNPVDWKRASGAYRLIMPVRFPNLPGFDVAGVVEEVGPGVTALRVGQRAHARLNIGNGGANAELVVGGIDVTVPIPDAMDDAQAAGLPLAGMTALQGLRDVCRMSMTDAGERVLVVGASGGVGHLAVQIARAAGAFVVGVCSARNAELVSGLGAHEVLDYGQPDPYAGQAPFDIVLDCVGGDPGPWMPLLGPRGRYASCLPGPKVLARAALNGLGGKTCRPVLLTSRAVDLATLDALFEAGKLRVVIDSRFPMADLAGAWRRSMEGRARGKIVVDAP